MAINPTYSTPDFLTHFAPAVSYDPPVLESTPSHRKTKETADVTGLRPNNILNERNFDELRMQLKTQKEIDQYIVGVSRLVKDHLFTYDLFSEVEEGQPFFRALKELNNLLDNYLETFPSHGDKNRIEGLVEGIGVFKTKLDQPYLDQPSVEINSFYALDDFLGTQEREIEDKIEKAYEIENESAALGSRQFRPRLKKDAQSNPIRRPTGPLDSSFSRLTRKVTRYFLSVILSG